MRYLLRRARCVERNIRKVKTLSGSVELIGVSLAGSCGGVVERGGIINQDVNYKNMFRLKMKVKILRMKIRNRRERKKTF